MAVEKQYKSVDYYERKLKAVMTRFDTTDYTWDYNRFGCWVQFTYKGQVYRFEHSVQKAQEHGIKLVYGSDAFAQLVLALEDLARIVERGIYELQDWCAGMKALPQARTMPWYITYLGLPSPPSSSEEIDAAYKQMAKVYHPDVGGSAEQFAQLQEARTLALDYIKNETLI